ncbi:hypothetical protein BJV82DRAFT_663671 [Fennellomyces sp. T-0311]|nr:hypothetical protein BJV82DRAFT_663671 [Fennellomyces sp. T-0311]
MKKPGLLLGQLTLVLCFILSVKAATPSPRANLGCVLLKSRIYCYGGESYRPTPGANTYIPGIRTNLFYSLELSSNERLNVSSLRTSWNEIGGVNPGPNYYYAMTAIPEHNCFLMDGGRGVGDGNTLVQYATVLFNATSNQWITSIPTGHTPVDSHSAVLGPNNQVYLSGGDSDKTFNGNTGPIQFPRQMNIFSIAHLGWSVGPNEMPLTTATRSLFQGVLGKDQYSIYYIGGIRPINVSNNNAVYMEFVNMTEVTIFDTTNGSWRNVSTAGPVTPTPRTDHTATLKPSTGEIILYGGCDLFSNNDARDDYFYLLNTDTMEWSNRTLVADNGTVGTGPIHSHSGYASLFIMFGVTPSDGSTNNIWVLDIEKWSWVTSLPGLPVDSSNSNTTETSSDDKQVSLRIGTVVSIVIGLVAGTTAIVCTVVFLCIRRKRRQNESDAKSDMTEDVFSDLDEDEAKLRERVYSVPHSLPTVIDLQLSPASNNTTVMAGKPDGANDRPLVKAVKPDGL